MTSSLVLGLGNLLAGADAFGPQVVTALQAERDLDGVTIADAGTDLLSSIGGLSGCERAILVDAVALPDAAIAATDTRAVAVIDETTFSEWEAPAHGVHEISPLVAVRLFRVMQRSQGGADRHAPIIHLVALLTTEADFVRPPTPGEIAAGSAAVLRLLHNGSTT